MSSVAISGNASGAGVLTIAAPNTASNYTLTLPTETGTLISTASTGQVIPKAALPTGSVLQVVSTNKNDTFSTASTTFIDLTGLSVSITPTSATSKILVLMRVMCSGSLAGTITLRGQLIRGATALDSGDSGATSSYSFINTRFVNYLDSPATTSATTYSYQFYGDGATWYVNQTGFSGNPASSQLTLMEIAA